MLVSRGHLSGGLHQAERALAGVGTAAYAERLRRAVQGAEAVLVVNPLTEAMVSPYAKSVRVVTAGMGSHVRVWDATTCSSTIPTGPSWPRRSREKRRASSGS